MKAKNYISLFLVVIVSTIGCSQNYGKLKTKSQSDIRLTQNELIDNWSDYNIWLIYSRVPKLHLIVFDPKDDGRKILVGSNWTKIKDQETWEEILKANTTSDGDFSMVWANYDYTTRAQEIWGPDNMLYGYIIYQDVVVEWVNLKLVDENSMQLSWRPTINGGNPL